MSTITIEPAFKKLIKAYAQVALKKIRKPTNHELNDLINDGIILFIETKEKQYQPNRNCSLRTFFIRILRNHFRDMVVKSYRTRHHFNNDIQKIKYIEYLQNKHKKEDPSKLACTSILLSDLSSIEKQYAEKMLLSRFTSMNGRRKETRKILQLTIEQEENIRKNIFIKIQK